MKLDDTLLGIFTKIQKEVQDKFGIEYSIEELNSVVDVQIEATKLGFTKGITVHWERFCKFVFTDRKTRKVENFNYMDELKERHDLLPQEKEALAKEKILEEAKKKKKYISDSTLSGNSSTVEDLIAAPVVNKTTLPFFKNITNKKAK